MVFVFQNKKWHKILTQRSGGAGPLKRPRGQDAVRLAGAGPGQTLGPDFLLMKGDAQPLVLLLFLLLFLLLLLFILLGAAAVVEAAGGQRLRQWDGDGPGARAKAGRRCNLRRSDPRQAVNYTL